MMLQADTFFPETPSRTFEQIPPRPPTPPRQSPRSTSKSKPKGSVEKSATPSAGNGEDVLISSFGEISPATSSAESAADKPKKRVVWSPWTTYHKPGSTVLSPAVNQLAPSSSNSTKALKSILKPYNPANSLLESSPTPSYERSIAAHSHASFAAMLESVIQALASTERSRKLDTYITFSNALKAYDEIPDLKAMEENMPRLSVYIKRDLEAKMEDGGNADSSLIQQAIKLLTILAWTQRLADAIDDQAASFFVQLAIQKIEEEKTPKIIVNHYLHFLAQQKFSPRIVTAARADKLISALDNLDERVTGKSITKERIDVYNKLLTQTKQTMLLRVADWMFNLLGGLLSGVKEARNRALICIGEVARVLGTEKAILRTLNNIFDSDAGNGKRMLESIKERLEFFVQDGEGVFVARMWGAILLLIRPVGDHWEYFTPWLRVIETCFNLSDKDVKVEAQFAWSKLIYAMNIGPQTTRKLLHFICKPVEQYLDPQNHALNTKAPRKAAVVNVCVLLYYGLRPNAGIRQIADIWEFVVIGLVELALKSKDQVNDGCNIISALFNGSTHKVWNESRVLNPPPLSFDELPRIDPKWVRSNTSLVLKTLELAFQRGSWEEAESPRGTRVLWQRFTKTLADAGSKEIKTSAELMEAVAHLFNMFQRIWGVGPAALNNATKDASPDSFVKKFTFLVVTTLDSLGAFCFTEKQLAYDEESKFSPASTPTHRYASGSSSVVLHPPILHMFLLFLRPSTGVTVDDEYYQCVKTILSKCCNSLDSRRKKLAVLAACAEILPRRDAQPLDFGMWQILAELVRKSLQAPAREKALLSPSPVGGEFKDVVKVLEWGCCYELPGWKQLFDDFTETVQSERGEVYVAAAIIEPLAEVLRHQKLDVENSISLRLGKYLVEKAVYPKNRAALENVSRGLYGIAGRRPTNSDTFEKLYSMVNHLLLTSYDLSENSLFITYSVDFIASVGDLLGRCPAASLMALLDHIQEGVGIWATDLSELLTTKDIIMKAVNMWNKVIEALERLPRHDGQTLETLKILISSGLESRRKAIVLPTITLWNKTFGKQTVLSYPSRVKNALHRLKPAVAELSLPTFPDDVDNIMGTPPEFSESQSQDQSEEIGRKKGARLSPAPSHFTFSSFEPRGRTASPSVIGNTPQRSRRTTPGSNRKKTPPRPKHMDSQLDFAPIESEGRGMDDSQLLTEHQKEVKERQSKASIVYPYLRMTPPRKIKRRSQSVEDAVSSTSPTATKMEDGKNSQFIFTIQPSPATSGEEFSEKMEIDELEITRILETPVKSGQDPDMTISFISETQSDSSLSPPPSIRGSRESSLDLPSELSSFRIDEDETRFPKPEKVPEVPEVPLVLSNTPSDEPSVDEKFVDAPEEHVYSSGNEAVTAASGPKNPKKITVEISPIKEAKHSDYMNTDSSIDSVVSGEMAPGEKQGTTSVENLTSDALHVLETGPDAQIITEERAAQESSATAFNRASAARSFVPKSSHDVLDTIFTRPSNSKPDSPSNTSSKGPKAGEERKKDTEISRSMQINSPYEITVTRRSARASARKAAQSAVAEKSYSTRKRKALAVDEYASSPGGRLSVDHASSPTPRERTTKRRKGLTEMLKEKAPKVGPDLNFILETQFSPQSSIPDSQGNDSMDWVAPTEPPGRRARGLFADGEEIKEISKTISAPNTTEPSTEDVEPPPPKEKPANKARQGRRKSAPRKSRGARKDYSERDSPEESDTTSGGAPGSQESAVAKKPNEQGLVRKEEITSIDGALENLHFALDVFEKLDLDPAACYRAEDMVFDAFARLRRRHR